MSRARIALIVLLVIGALLTPFAPAQASSTLLCSGYSSCTTLHYSNYGYSTHKSISYWNMYTGTNCTNYAAYRLVTTNGMPNVRPKSTVGNAKDWGIAEASITNKTPAVGAIAWWGITGHHVAYIERVVSSTEIVVSESNWSGEFDWRRITSSSGWPDGFIHFADLRLRNTVKPTITGVVKVGAKLTATAGTWSPTTATYAYRWLVDGLAVQGATAKTYVPAPAQEGHALAVKVTASKTSYPSASVTSSRQVIAPGALAVSSPASISGLAQVDETLSASPGVWAPGPVTYAYQWVAGGVVVAGATSPTFTPGPENVDQPVMVRVTGSKTGYADRISTSVATARVAPGVLLSTASPTISGSAAVGTLLSADPGSWSKPGLTYTYTWSVDGQVVADATSSTYTPIAPDYGHTITVSVAASRHGYMTATAVSVATVAVVRGTLTMHTAPSITGTPRVGAPLTAVPGTWSPEATFTYQWYVGMTAISGATGKSFTPNRSQLGHTIHVRVVARRAGFTSVAARSPRTALVALGKITFSASPTITGYTRVGSRLWAHPGTYRPTNATIRYQWLRNGSAIAGSTNSSRYLTSYDAHAELSVRVTFAASGYTTRIVTTASVGPIT